MAVVAEIFALEFKFDKDALPAVRTDLADGFAVGEAVPSGFDTVAQGFCQHAEEEDDSLFVCRFMS